MTPCSTCSVAMIVSYVHRGCGGLRDLYVLGLIETADTNRPDHRAVDVDRHAALHLNPLGGDRRRPAGVDRRLEGLGGFLEERGRTSFTDREIDADRTSVLHLLEQDQVARRLDYGNLAAINVGPRSGRPRET